MTAPEEPQKKAEQVKNLRESRRERRAAAKSNVTPFKKVAPTKSAPQKAPPAKKATPTTPKPAAEPGKRPYPGAQPGTWYVRGEYKPKKDEALYEATGESGQISVRSRPKPVTHAVSWAETDRPGSDVLKLGRIHSFHANEESAAKMAASLVDGRPNDRAVVVEARPYTGQPTR